MSKVILYDSEWFSSESGVDVIKVWNRRTNDAAN